MAKGEVVRVGAVADLHYSQASRATLLPLFERLAGQVDVLLLGGDLTDYGHVHEAEALARDLTAALKTPLVTVLGNHDYEAGKGAEVMAVLRNAGIQVLDGEATEVRGIGFAGTKGFAGGFGRGTLESFGEPVVKQFVREVIEEALKLERALARLRTANKIALLHYSPIAATVVGEPPEIFPFLGCSRLEEPINRFGVTAVFHGHAHRGTLEGHTATGVPVYNVALPLMRRTQPNGSPCRILEFPLQEAPVEGSNGS